MKKILSLLLVVSFLLATSCEKDDDPVDPSGTVKLEAIASPDSIFSYEVSYVVNEIRYAQDSLNGTWSYSYTAMPGDKYELDCWILDLDDCELTLNVYFKGKLIDSKYYKDKHITANLTGIIQ